jgi:hypothetical protein
MDPFGLRHGEFERGRIIYLGGGPFAGSGQHRPMAGIHLLRRVLMSLVRVHNFSLSLDGFGAGEGQSLEAPFGHAGNRLHEWFFPTRSFHSLHETPGDWADAPASTIPLRATGIEASARGSWAGISSDRSGDRGLTEGLVGGLIRLSIPRCLCSPIIRGPRSR